MSRRRRRGPSIASGWPKVALSEAMMKSVLCASLASAAVGDPVDRGEDRLAQLSQRVEGAVEVLALPQPVLLGHVLALAQVAADGEGPVTSAGEDDHANGGTDRDRLEDLGQQGAHLGGDRVVGVRPVQGDDRDPPAGDDSRAARTVRSRRRRPAAGRSRALPSDRCRSGWLPRASPVVDVRSGLELRQPAHRPQARARSSTRRRG